MKKAILATLFIALFLSAASQLSWGKMKRAKGEPYTDKGGRLTVTLPVGWKFEERLPGDILAVLDNEIQQRMIIKYTPLEDPLPSTKRTLTPGLNPNDLAKALTEDLIATDTTEGLSILESGPAMINGQPGCRVVVRFRNREIGRADMMKVFYSAIHDSQLYMLIYDALAKDYYDRGLPVFEETVKTFKFNKP